MSTHLDTTVLYIQNESNCVIDTVPFMKRNGLKLLETTCFETACEMFSHHKIDIILIELELESKCGLEFIQCLREKNILTPAIITTNDLHKIPFMEALNLEISSCLLHPYKEEDLLHALKQAAIKAGVCHPLSYTDLNMGFSYDPLNKKIISANGETIKLCNKEIILIELLLQNKEHITSYEMIETIVWRDDFMSIDSLRTLIRGIRKKTYPNIITNHNSIGYKIDL
ncbi:MAG: response regulator [Sulfuricurvum sp.]|jgi:DNA-binding response OmpR family regulator